MKDYFILVHLCIRIAWFYCKDQRLKKNEIYSCKISNLVYFYQQAIHKNQNENIDVVSFIYLNRYQDILFYVCRSWEKLHHVHKT